MNTPNDGTTLCIKHDWCSHLTVNGLDLRCFYHLHMVDGSIKTLATPLSGIPEPTIRNTMYRV